MFSNSVPRGCFVIALGEERHTVTTLGELDGTMKKHAHRLFLGVVLLPGCSMESRYEAK